MPERSMPVCLTESQHCIITEYAKGRGMTYAGQAVEPMLYTSCSKEAYYKQKVAIDTLPGGLKTRKERARRKNKLCRYAI